MMLMDTNITPQLLHPELSYTITGILFSTHNELGPYAREKQYCDLIEKKLKEAKITYQRECAIGDTGNILDFLIENKIVLEIKSKRLLLPADYYQIQRYLQEAKIKLGVLVNFRNKYIKPVRVIRIDTENSKKYLH